MKKKRLLLVLSIIFTVAVICLLASCDFFGGDSDGRKKINKPIASNNIRYLRFVDGEGNTILDYQVDQYYSAAKLQDKLDNDTVVNYCKPINGKYLDGTEFSAAYDALNDYIVYHVADSTITNSSWWGTLEYPVYTVVVEMVPIEYTITFMGVDGATFDAPSTYNVTMSGQPLPTASKPYYHFLGWYERKEGEPNTKYIKETYPYVCENVTYYASWQAISFDIVYNDDGVPNTNQKIIYQKDGVYQLLPIETNEYWAFHGWKLNGEYVTTLDPMELWDESAPAWDREKYTVTLSADLEYFRHDFDYYVDGELFQHYNFDYKEWQAFKVPAVPTREHYSGSWSKAPTEFKDSRFDAVYEIDKYEVAVQTNISGYTLEMQKYEYGTTYAAIYEQLSYPNKHLIGLYLDNGYTQKAMADDLILQGGTLYAKFSDRYEIGSYTDWNKLVEHSDAYFVLTNDVNFLGSEIPIVSEFKGILDGQGFKVTNFIYQNNSCPTTFGLFCVNDGTISNVVFSGGIFTVISAPSNKSISVGFLTGINNGTIDNVTVDATTVKITCYDNPTLKDKWLDSAENSLYAGVFAAINLGTIKHSTLLSNVTADFNTKMYAEKSDSDTGYMRTWASYGLIAGSNGGTISHVTSSGTLNSSASREEYTSGMFGNHFTNVYYPLRVGGIVGANDGGGSISDSLSNADVKASFADSARRNYYGIVDIGGVAGVNNGQVARCQAGSAKLTACANAETRIGGLVGTNDANGTLRASYSTAQFLFGTRSATEKTYCGGLVGLNSGAITYCYAIVSELELGITSGNSRVYFGGLFGRATDSGTAANSFVKLATDGVASSDVCGFYGNATVFRCYVYATDAAVNYDPCDDVTTCDTESDLLKAIADMGFDLMGFELTDNGYPTLPTVGNIQE